MNASTPRTQKNVKGYSIIIYKGEAVHRRFELTADAIVIAAALTIAIPLWCWGILNYFGEPSKIPESRPSPSSSNVVVNAAASPSSSTLEIDGDAHVAATLVAPGHDVKAMEREAVRKAPAPASAQPLALGYGVKLTALSSQDGVRLVEIELMRMDKAKMNAGFIWAEATFINGQDQVVKVLSSDFQFQEEGLLKNPPASSRFAIQFFGFKNFAFKVPEGEGFQLKSLRMGINDLALSKHEEVSFSELVVN